MFFEDHMAVGVEVFDDIELTQSPWRGAAAYHLLFLAHSYLNDGKSHDALVTTLKLRDYEDIIPIEELYCLLAVASCFDSTFGICSKAFIKLELVQNVSI